MARVGVGARRQAGRSLLQTIGNMGPPVGNSGPTDGPPIAWKVSGPPGAPLGRGLPGPLDPTVLTGAQRAWRTRGVALGGVWEARDGFLTERNFGKGAGAG